MVNSKKKLLFILPIYFFITASLSQWFWYESYHSQLSVNKSQLNQFHSQLSNQLEKYAYIPRLLSKDRELIDALQQPNNSAQIEITNRYLHDVNAVIEASDTYLIDINGTTLASSNWDAETSFIGRNFAFRPYFQQALLGDKGQYFALGSTSGKRGYYYSFPVIYAAEIVGVIVVKMDLTSIENQWHLSKALYMVTDSNNIVFMSNKKEWLLKSLSQLNAQQHLEIKDSQRYLDLDIATLNFEGDLAAPVTEISNKVANVIQQTYLTHTKDVENHPLFIRVMSPRSSVVWSLVGFLAILHLIYVLALFIFLLRKNNAKRKHQIEQIYAESKQRLEFEVMERTAELQAEIGVRAKTEAQLKATQVELIQAAKLAVLGQLSTSISHELNNPLAAIRSYANNGRKYLQKDMVGKAEDNFARISSLTHRMKKISQQLKAFARDPSNDEWRIEPIQSLIDTSIELVMPQANSHTVNVNKHYLGQLKTLPDLHVKVNTIQFEQVLINILSNAIQALQDKSDKQIDIQLEITNNLLTIHIDDSGDGVSENHKLTLFDPFISNKPNGMGLGLSLSQSIIHNMNGEIEVAHSPLGGARFSVIMPIEIPHQLKELKT